ncbi:hypothetical protein IV203_001616 [Nitzschia inconspicua]|uniref:Uncharacterized protein n=1 Tax=Nitzschia inconspicua TaxID=303405 RepID=A0A9K3L8U4_9STRA|nr:hypothetical protein IV203_001616 [Nitzschia inconspicua]
MMNNPVRQYFYATSPSNEKAEHENDWRNSWFFGSNINHHFSTAGGGERAFKEVACATVASFLVSPMVSIIDKAIVQDVSGSAGFMKAMGTATKEMITSPRAFLSGLSFRLTFVVYAGTYAVANLSEMALDMNRIEDDNQRKNMKVAASAVANIGLLAWRDSVFAREFSANTPKHKTPMRTIGLFAARDASTMYATFYAAPKAAVFLQEHYGVAQYPAEFSMALAIPVFTQILTAPLHIHAMDYYANPDASTADRFAAIRKEFPTVSFARGFRILPAFGIGSFSNNRFREYFIHHTWDPEPEPLQKRLTNFGRRLTEGVISSSPQK